MFHVFRVAIPSWEATIRAAVGNSDARMLRASLQNYWAEVDKIIMLSAHETLNDAAGSTEIIVAREWKHVPQSPLPDRDAPHPLMDREPRPLGYVHVVGGVFCAVLYVGPSIFDELWNRHVFGGPMPRQLQLQVDGFTEPANGDELIWDITAHPHLPVTELFFEMIAEVRSPTILTR